MARLELNDTELDALLTGRGGPVFRTTLAFAEEVVAIAKREAPLGFDQGGYRANGGLRADMRVRDIDVTPLGIKITVGTDPLNPKDGYPYGYVVHQGRPGFASKKGIMQFMTRDFEFHRREDVGPAEGHPFLYLAVEAANAGADPQFELIPTPGLD